MAGRYSVKCHTASTPVRDSEQGCDQISEFDEKAMNLLLGRAVLSAAGEGF